MEALTASRVAAQMMQNLLLEEGDIVTIRSATLRKGTYVKLQPHTKARGPRCTLDALACAGRLLCKKCTISCRV